MVNTSDYMGISLGYTCDSNDFILNCSPLFSATEDMHNLVLFAKKNYKTKISLISMIKKLF